MTTVTGDQRAENNESTRVDRQSPSIVCENLVKIYKTGELEVVALQGLDLVVHQGEFIAIIGASGSGKSTLLNILGGLDVPTAGNAKVADHDLLNMSNAQRTAFRRDSIGFVWQQTAANLLPYLTARENIETPMLLAGASKRTRQERSKHLLQLVGLQDRHDHLPSQLSGGEQQRVAIATAIVNSPRVLLADEPTGELDTATSGEVFELLRTISRFEGVTVVVVTHDPLVANHVSRTVAIRDGRASSEVRRRSTLSPEGDHHLVAEEYALLDRVGRLQLPEDYVSALNMERRVRLRLDSDHINVYPHDEQGEEAEE